MKSSDDTPGRGAPAGNKNAAKDEGMSARFPAPRHFQKALDRAKALAQAAGQTLTDWIREAINEKLDKDDPPPDHPLLKP